jgi:hypothetical protein
MSAHPPPVPPDQRGPHDGKASAETDEGRQAKRRNEVERNLDQQGRQGNTKQNTDNQGQQQDR